MSNQVEPGPEIAQFLQEIEAHQQHANLGKLGRFQEASAFDQEADNEQIVAVPGSTVITETWAKAENGIWRVSKKAIPGFTRYFARWRFPTVSLWKRLGSYRQNIFTQEKKVWRVFLTETSLTNKPLMFSEELLSEASFCDIMEFSPASIPTQLVRNFLKTTTLPPQELHQIEQECMELWRKDGGSVRDPHPLLEEAISAMNVYEKFGIVAWSNLGDVPIKTYTVMKKALEVYGICQDLNQKEDYIRRKAAELAGVRPPQMTR